VISSNKVDRERRIAIVHDWLTVYAGAERVLEQMLNCYPKADLFSLVDFIPADNRKFLKDKSVTTSFIQRLPFARKLYRTYLPLMPLAIEQFDLSSYDLVISSSHAVAKGVLTGPDQLHLCMCYSPIRYAWDLQHQYLQESGLTNGIKGGIAKYILHAIRIWDLRTANGVDQFIAISNFISRRIRKIYRRKSIVIYPPVDIDSFELCNKKENYYLTASRMVPYKKIDLIVKAFRKMPDKHLIVIGDGPDFKKIELSVGPNVTLLGYQSFDVLSKHMKNAKAFIFAAEEDFGIAPLEAQASGTPVIAFGKGGALETIVGSNITGKRRTGIFFYRQTSEAIIAAIQEFESLSEKISPDDCRQNAMRFSPQRFCEEFKSYVETAYKEFNHNGHI
jgi:glycosyltransferase involved in cell wall biosynthesis